MNRTLGRLVAGVGAGTLVTFAALTLTTNVAGATEFGNHNYLGILRANPPSGFPVSPTALDLSSGAATITVNVAITNLTSTTQSVPMDFSVHRILTYQGQSVSDGQPGQPGLTFPTGSAALTTQMLYGAKQTGTFTVTASGQATISFTTTIADCGYYQIDFNHWNATLKKTVLLASGFTRALGCVQPQLAPRLTPGFWKNHQSAATALLAQTLGNYQVTSFSQVTDIFAAMKCNSPADCLAAHLLAAQFDVSSGSATCINGTTSAANALLQSIGYAGPQSYSLTAAQSAQALSLEVGLDNYTNDSTSATC